MAIERQSGRGGPLNTLLTSVLAVGVVAVWSSSALCQTADAPSVQDYQSRLKQLGGTTAADVQATQPAHDPRCDDPAQFELTPSCGSPPQGVRRGFSLIHAAPPARSEPHNQQGAVVRHPHHIGNRPEDGPSDCAIEDTADNRGVNLCVTFALNSATLSAGAKVSLNNFARALMSDRVHTGFLIEGFTDSTGNEAANKALSTARAKSVTDYLVSQGVPRSMLDPRGVGASQFISGRAHTDPANRRVEARLPGA